MHRQSQHERFGFHGLPANRPFSRNQFLDALTHAADYDQVEDEDKEIQYSDHLHDVLARSFGGGTPVDPGEYCGAQILCCLEYLIQLLNNGELVVTIARGNPGR